jgi:CRISPR/Cas system type I-B associated protein Csh2 (Cas7 group RAMP superfamily)
MNKTTKAQYDFATRMLKGKVEVDDVVMMTGLSKEEVEKLKDEVVPHNTDAEILKNLDNVDLDIGELLYDNLPAEDLELEGFHEIDPDEEDQ